MIPTLALFVMAAVQAPGSSPNPYWQQRVAYEITASLDESRGCSSGVERVTYVNNSPDTLHQFSLHLYLNAFRPGSRWSDADSVEGRRRFNDLKDPDFGFNHVSDVRLMGQAVMPVYPFAPDSTIVRFILPAPLAPGDSMPVEMRYDARPSTVPRRQGRQGRAFDFAQWYPRVVVYDRYGWEEHPLYPAGEFYGEFGTFKVQLDVPEDQVVGATGVPVCGDPGWERANQDPSRPVEYQRNYYGSAAAFFVHTRTENGVARTDCSFAPDGSPAAPGRKTILWYATDVHHFAMSMRPDYRYEGGHYGDVAVHVLYQPGDERSWGGGVAVKRTETSLAWLNGFFGKFAWPQITNVHRIEGGGTEFPMMIMNGGASQGLITHELGHNYVMGILANNEWKEGFLDEGFTSFQTTLAGEASGLGNSYPGLEQFILGLDLDGYSEPVSLVSEDYRDFSTYNLMIYVRGELFYHQLRYIVGDSTLRQIMHVYYDRWKLKHVDEAAFEAVAEEVSHRDLSDFFGQWLHGTDLYDYAVGRVRRTRLADGSWRTRVEVKREAPGMIPVEVAVIAGHDTTVTRAEGRAEREWVEVVTPNKPGEVVLDPQVRTHDWNMLNNRRRSTLFGFLPSRRDVARIDKLFSTDTRRDRVVNAWLPTVWYNDQAGLTFGIRSRSNYMGRFEQNTFSVTRSTGWANSTGDPRDVGYFARVRNPVATFMPRTNQVLEVMKMEGRSGAGLVFERSALNHLGFGPRTTRGVSLRWVSTTDLGYLDPGFYQDAGTVEGQMYVRSANQWGRWQVAGSMSGGGGVEYLNPGAGIDRRNRYDAQLYFRGTAEATARRGLGHGFGLALRAFAGVSEGQHDVVKQRQFYLSGADPYGSLSNPFSRSRGALLERKDVNFQTPGGGDVRGIDPHISGSQVYALNGELERVLRARPRAGLFNRIALAGFADAALADAATTPGGGNPHRSSSSPMPAWGSGSSTGSARRPS